MDGSLTFSPINGRSMHNPVDHQAARTQVVAEEASTEVRAAQNKAPMFVSSNLAQYLNRKFACHVTVHLDGQAAVEDMEALNLDWVRIEGPDMQLKVRKCHKAAVIVACAGFIGGTTPAGSFDLRPGQDFVFVPDLSELDLAIRASDTRGAQFLIFLFERNELEDVALYPQSGRPASPEEDGLRILALQRLQMIRRPEASTMLELQFRLAQSATAVCGLGEKMRFREALLQILNAFLVERGKQNPAVGNRSEAGTLEDICIQLTGMLDPDLTVLRWPKWLALQPEHCNCGSSAILAARLVNGCFGNVCWPQGAGWRPPQTPTMSLPLGLAISIILATSRAVTATHLAKGHPRHYRGPGQSKV
jgi:hypothetical protein